MKLKTAIKQAREKASRKAYVFKFISFSMKVGPNISVIDRITEGKKGYVRVNSALIYNRNYDIKKHGSRMVPL